MFPLVRRVAALCKQISGASADALVQSQRSLLHDSVVNGNAHARVYSVTKLPCFASSMSAFPTAAKSTGALPVGFVFSPVD
ncbi:MAG TPA: hypothetical protein V6C81_31435 [Planktothrix sp.]